MRRRRFLATAATALALPLSGCVLPDAGSLTMDRVSDEAIARRQAQDVDALARGPRGIVTDAIAGETPTREDTGPPFAAARPFEYEGAYYDVSSEVVERRPSTQYELRIDYDGVADPASVIAYAELPAADRRALDRLLPPPPDPPTGWGFDADVASTYADDAESVLVPEPEYDAVAVDGTNYSVAVGDARSIAVSVYSYDAERIADDAAELGRRLRERYLFALTDLSEDERAVVTEAIDEGYYPDTPSGGFQSLLERFRSHEPIRSTRDVGHWLVRYDDRVYWAQLGLPQGTTL
jgi:hypothetical protein